MAKTIQFSGTRKKATARGILTEGTGKILINGKSSDNYTPRYLQLKVIEPMLIAGNAVEKVDINVRVAGGGINGQAEAARLVIAKLLAEYKKPLREEFLKYDRNLLVADVRYKESRKPNTHGKARAKRQKSYR
jgi:small subunit ribosomal protein S9